MQDYIASPTWASLSQGNSSSFAPSAFKPARPRHHLTRLFTPNEVKALIFRLKGLEILDVANRLGLRQLTRHSLSPCPVCHAERRNKGATQGPGPIGIRPSTGGWECHRCKVKGDLPQLATFALFGTSYDQTRWPYLQEFFFGDVDLTPRTFPVGPAAQAPSAPLLRPPQEEISNLWQHSRAVTLSPKASGYLQARGLDPERLSALDLLRDVPKELSSQLPTWGLFGKRNWVASGHRLIAPVYNENGYFSSVRARSINQSDKQQKEICPQGFEVRGLCFANGAAQAMLSGLSKPQTVILTEGLPDFLSWAQTTTTSPVLGLFAGSLTKELMARIPTGAKVVFRHHNDKNLAGRKLADKALSLLADRCEVYWLDETVDSFKDDNDRLQAGTLTENPFTNAIPFAEPAPTRQERLHARYLLAVEQADDERQQTQALPLALARAKQTRAMLEAATREGATVIQADCGVGKTYSALQLAKKLIAEGKTVSIVVPTLKLARELRAEALKTGLDSVVFFAGPAQESCQKDPLAVLAHWASGLKSREQCQRCPFNQKNGGTCTIADGFEGKKDAKLRLGTHQGAHVAAKGADLVIIDEYPSLFEIQNLSLKTLEVMAQGHPVLAGGKSPQGTQETMRFVAQELLQRSEKEHQGDMLEGLREKIASLLVQDHGKTRVRVLRAFTAEPGQDHETHPLFTSDEAREVLDTARALLLATAQERPLYQTTENGLLVVTDSPINKLLQQLPRAIVLSATPGDLDELRQVTKKYVHVERIRAQDAVKVTRTLFADSSGTYKALAPHGRPDFAGKAYQRAQRYLLEWLEITPLHQLLIGTIKPIALGLRFVWQLKRKEPILPKDWKAWCQCFDGDKATAKKALADAQTQLNPLVTQLEKRGITLATVWYGDEAGTNEFAGFDAVATIGDAFPNLDAAKLQFATTHHLALKDLEPPHAGFQAYYETQARAASGQTQGRVRDADRATPAYHFHFGRLSPAGWEGAELVTTAPGQKRSRLSAASVAPCSSLSLQGWKEVARAVGSKRELSRRLGVSWSTLLNYMNGTRPTPPELWDQAQALLPGGHDLAIESEVVSPNDVAQSRMVIDFSGGHDLAIESMQESPLTAPHTVMCVSVGEYETGIARSWPPEKPHSERLRAGCESQPEGDFPQPCDSGCLEADLRSSSKGSGHRRERPG